MHFLVAASDRMNMDFQLGLGIALLAIGFGLGLWRKRRKFYRTNAAGVEQFKSYSGKLKGTLLDGMLHVLSLFLLIMGAVTLGFHFQDSWGWIVLLPFYLWMLFLLFLAS